MGCEALEHAELGLERLARVQVPAVLAAPEEGLAAGDALDVGDVDLAVAQHLQLGLAEVVADGADDADPSKKEAASAKCTAAPPSIRSRSPNGVLTAS